MANMAKANMVEYDEYDNTMAKKNKQKNMTTRRGSSTAEVVVSAKVLRCPKSISSTGSTSLAAAETAAAREGNKQEVL